MNKSEREESTFTIAETLHVSTCNGVQSGSGSGKEEFLFFNFEPNTT